jgi:DNA polymerase-3 subunit gamma/tau
MPVFYRTYRPQRFAEVVGQSHIVRTLTNAAKSGTLAHAYLFTGSRGVGKTTVARLIAKAANCPNLKDGDPCGICDICQAVEQGRFVDLIEIDAASHTGVDNVRELIEHVQFAPSQGKRKVFIIDEVHMLSKAAFNALLKTLEEPPAHALFVLATTDIHKVPDTIISRTQRFDFRKIPALAMREHLAGVAAKEALTVEPAVLDLVVQRSDGGLRDALSLLDKLAALGGEVTLTDAELLLGVSGWAVSEQLYTIAAHRNAGVIPAFFAERTASGTDFALLTEDFLEYCRMVLVSSVTADFELWQERFPAGESAAKQWAQSVSVNEQMKLIRLCLRAHKEASSSPIPELPLMLAILEFIGKDTPKTPASVAMASSAATTVVAPAEPRAKASQPTAAQSVAPTASTSAESLSQEELVSVWGKVVDDLLEQNRSMGTIVKNAMAVTAQPHGVVISVKFSFHRDHLQQVKNIETITTILAAHSGKQVPIIVQLAPATETKMSGLDALTETIKLFGGEVIE